MPYFRDSFVQEEGNPIDLPSRVRSKRSRVDPEFPWKNENQTNKQSMTDFYRQSHECDSFRRIIIDDSDNNNPASTSNSSPLSSVLQHEHHFLSHIPPAKSTIELSKLKPSSNSLILSPPRRLKQPRKASRDFASGFEPTHLALSGMSLPIRSSLNLDREISPNQLSSKLTFRDMNGKKISHRATTNNGSSLSLGSSSKIDSYIRSNKLSRQVSFKSTSSSDIHQSKTEPHSLGSSSKFNSYIISDKLSRQSSLKSTTTSKIYQTKSEPYGLSLSNNFSLKIKPELLPSSQLSRTPSFRSTIHSVINLLKSKEGEELDTELSLGSNRSSSKVTSSLTLDTDVIKNIDTLTSQDCKPFNSKLEIPSRKLITPKKPTFEHKIDLLRQQIKSPTDTIDVVRIEALAQARTESLRRERILKEHLKRNKVSSTKAEDLLSQSLRMGRFSVQYAEMGEVRGKRSREGSSKEYFREESTWSENPRMRYFSNKSPRREIPASENGELDTIPPSTGQKEKEKVKELGSSLQWSQPNFQQHTWSIGDIDLSLGLQTPSKSNQRADIAKIIRQK